MTNSVVAGGAGSCIDRAITFNAKTANALYRDDCDDVRVNALYGLNLIRASNRIFQALSKCGAARTDIYPLAQQVRFSKAKTALGRSLSPAPL